MFLIDYHETLNSFLRDEIVSNQNIKLSFLLEVEKFFEGSSEVRVHVLNVWLTAADNQAEKMKSGFLKIYIEQCPSLQERIIEIFEEIHNKINSDLSFGYYSIPGVVPPFTGMHIGRFLKEMRRDCPNAIFEEYFGRLQKIFKEFEA